MNDDELSPEQRRDVDAFYAEYEAQLARVNVDMRDATPRMNEIAEPIISDVMAKGWSPCTSKSAETMPQSTTCPAWSVGGQPAGRAGTYVRVVASASP